MEITSVENVTAWETETSVENVIGTLDTTSVENATEVVFETVV